MTGFAGGKIRMRRTIVVAATPALLGSSTWACDHFEKNGLALQTKVIE
jgi:hypothetical protein